jgi:hypothetical protein
VFDQLQANDLPFQPNIAAAIGQIYAGVTPQSAAQANLCTVEEITHALALPAANSSNRPANGMQSTYSPPNSVTHPTSWPGPYPSDSR